MKVTVVVLCTGVLFVLATGCRPNEAAYIVRENSFRKTSAYPGSAYVATVPPEATKTKERYRWALKERFN